MDSLFLLQFACFIFMLINAFFVALSHLHVRWENKRYERSRWMIVVALIGLAIQYAVQMVFGFVALRKIFACKCNHSMARSSRYASCHLFYYLIIYSRSCRIACLVVLQSYVYCSRQQLYSNRRAIG